MVLLFQKLFHSVLKYLVLDSLIRLEIFDWESKIDGIREEAKGFNEYAWNDITNEIENKRVTDERYPSCAQQVHELYDSYAFGPSQLILRELNNLETMKTDAIDFLNDAGVKVRRAVRCSGMPQILTLNTKTLNSLLGAWKKVPGINKEFESLGFRDVSIALEKFTGNDFTTKCLQTWIGNSGRVGCEFTPTTQDLGENLIAGVSKVQQDNWLEINRTFVDALESSSHKIWKIKDDYSGTAGMRRSDMIQCSEKKPLKRWHQGGGRPNLSN